MSTTDQNTTEKEELQDVDVKQQQEDKKADKKSKKKEKKDPIKELQEELGTEKDKFLRLFAEFENYKKRTSKERVELFKTAGQEVITALLPVIDDFDRALKEIGKTEQDNELFKGVTLINDKLISVLKVQGLEGIEVEQGSEFDAEVHDAITQIPAPSDDLKGKIIDVVEKGYTLGDKIIRHPKVVVGK
jgi:molecular chaperone GrpE